LGYVLGGAAGEFYTPGGQRDIDESFLVLLNAYHEDIDFRLPELPVEMEWEPLVDTTTETGLAETGGLYRKGDTFPLTARSFALFINRAPERAVRTMPTGAIHPDEPPSVAPPVAESMQPAPPAADGEAE
jgi:glycogen operon protein